MADSDQILYGATSEREPDQAAILEREIDDLQELRGWKQYLRDSANGIMVGRFLISLSWLDQDQYRRLHQAEHQATDRDDLTARDQAFDQLRSAYSTDAGELLMNPAVAAGAAAWKITRSRIAKCAAMALAGEHHLTREQFRDLADGWLSAFGSDSLDDYRSGGDDGRL